MSITKRIGLLSTLAVALVMGLAGCKTSGTVTSLVTAKGEDTYKSWLAKPEGDGPFPAVVLMHGCSGTQRTTTHMTSWRGLNRHARLLNANGYVTLIVDSFEARRITDGCQTGAKYYSVQVGDAHAAFDRLASLPIVDADRIGFAGFSLGGGSAIRLAIQTTVDSRRREGRGSYAALVAYYPWCEADMAFILARPFLVLIGEKDDWTPASRCIAMHSIAEFATAEMELEVYPGAHHSFDMPMQGRYKVQGAPGEFHTVAASPAALRDSQARMLAFFDKHLGASQ